MNHKPTTIERALELARSGEGRSLREIEKRLQQEGYPDAPGQLAGKAIRLQLRKLWQAALLAQPVQEAL